MREVAVARGDGVGPEIMAVTLRALEAVEAPLAFLDVEMGAEVFGRGISSGMTEEAQAVVERCGVLLKGPMETPKGKGVKSIHETAQTLWGTYANKRVFRTLKGVAGPASRGSSPIHITLIRENTEDTYGAVEHLQTQDVAQCRRFITRPGSRQIHRYAFEAALRKGAKRVTCGHKANIMKLTDGLFLETFYEVAAQYPQLVADDLMVDDMAMRLVMAPEAFDVVVLPNLQGDILSDLCAGLVGGLGYAPSADIGDHVAIFEAVHGTAPDLVGQDRANPSALLLSAVMMLRHFGLFDHASHLENALEQALLEMRRVPDLGYPPAPFSTRRFEAALLDAVRNTKPNVQWQGQQERSGVPSTPSPTPAPGPRVMVSAGRKDQRAVGVDIFVESTHSPEELAQRLRELAGPDLELKMLSNRGTQVWPVSSRFTDCVDHYRVRFLSPGHEVGMHRLMNLAAAVSERARLCSLEVLLEIDGKPAFSMAQGQ
jgi:isocitrate dehydrogenase